MEQAIKDALIVMRSMRGKYKANLKTSIPQGQKYFLGLMDGLDEAISILEQERDKCI